MQCCILRLTKYIAARGEGYERKVESKILTDAAPYLSDFVARLFKINGERAELEKTSLSKTRSGDTSFLSSGGRSRKYKAEQIAETQRGRTVAALPSSATRHLTRHSSATRNFRSPR